MYNLKRNNFHKNPKNSNIQTPPQVSQFIFELLKDKFPRQDQEPIFDPCCGEGNLLRPWKESGYFVLGTDINEQSSANYVSDFLSREDKKRNKKIKPALILCNPPFNGYGKKLGSEVWLDKIIELFGKEIPIVLFTPVGFCANLTLQSKRYEKFENGTYPAISSIITLPKNVFEGVIFHSEILIFNIKGLKVHYFYKPYGR